MKLTALIAILELHNTLFVLIIILICFAMNANFKNAKNARKNYKIKLKLPISFQMIQLYDISKSKLFNLL